MNIYDIHPHQRNPIKIGSNLYVLWVLSRSLLLLLLLRVEVLLLLLGEGRCCSRLGLGGHSDTGGSRGI